MRSIVLLLLTLITTAGTINGQASQYTNSGTRMVPYMTLPPAEKQKDIQTKYHLQEWSDGVISFKGNPQQLKRPLLFDIYNNTVYYLENGQTMEFITPVYQFTMTLKQETDSTDVLFRSGYPPIERNDEITFYEVLVDGKFQLLKCKAKSVYLHKDLKAVEEDRVLSKELLYVYTPDKKIVLIKKDQSQILDQLPEYATKIKAITDSRKLKLKNEKALKQLFTELNNSL